VRSRKPAPLAVTANAGSGQRLLARLAGLQRPRSQRHAHPLQIRVRRAADVLAE
jgi:hypothetical protein